MAADEISRVRYFERQFLRAIDFRAEQQYDRDARRRHALASHTWGIVTGLELHEVPDAGGSGFVDVVLQPGVAIDGFGREIVCFDPVRLDGAIFESFHSTAHQYVWIGYDEQDAGATTSGWADCQDGSATRVAETYRLFASPPPPYTDDIVVGGVAAVPAPTPEGVPELPDDQSVPYQELPQSSPGDRWLIQLGVVFWDGNAQRFSPADPKLVASTTRTYAGAVADSIRAPAQELTIRRRRAETDVDANPFTRVEGRLRVQGRINAEKDVWVEGGHVRFTYDKGDEESVALTLRRERPAGAPGTHQLRVRIGDVAAKKAALSIGPGADAAAMDVVRVTDDDLVSVPTGRLSFASKTRQMLDLWGTPGAAGYGIGVQSSTLYFRSGGGFCWFQGGKHDDGAASPGDSGSLQMRLDESGDLYAGRDVHVDGNVYFGARVRQMLNLWSTRYGIGVQSGTLYSRTDGDFCWFRGGLHNDDRSNAGGGVLAMKLDDSSSLYVAGALGVGGDARVQGTMRIAGDLQVQGHAPSVIKVRRYERAKQNVGQGPVTWVESVDGDFDEIYEAFVVFNGFSLFTNLDPQAFDNFGQVASVNAIPQHVYVRVVSIVDRKITLKAFCQESGAALETDNSMLLTLVVIGRKGP
jgi:hypothetical protein